MNKYIALLLSLLLLTSCAGKTRTAKSGSGGDEIEDVLDSESSRGSKTDTSIDEPVFNKSEVVSAEYEKLANAKKARSEASILAAASVILSKDPDDLKTLNTMGLYYYENKQYGMAKILFKRAMKAHPNEPALHNNLGVVYLSEGEVRLAIESLKKSVELKSSYRAGATNLSSIYLEYGDYQRSLEPLETAYKATRSDLGRGDATAVDIASNYALALMGSGKYDEAQGIYEKITESPTRNPTPYLNYAILLVEVLKKKKDAVRVLSKLKFMTEDNSILRRAEELEKKLE